MPPNTNAEEAEQFCDNLQDLLELTPKKKKDVFFIIGDWMQKHKSRDTWSNRQVWPWITKRSRAKLNRILPREHTGHSKHLLSTAQETILHIDFTRWSMPKSH